MEIKEPIQRVEPLHREGTYAAVYAALENADGAWVPVACGDKKEANRVYTGLRIAARMRGLEVRRRKLTIYVRVEKPVAAIISAK